MVQQPTDRANPRFSVADLGAESMTPAADYFEWQYALGQGWLNLFPVGRQGAYHGNTDPLARQSGGNRAANR